MSACLATKLRMLIKGIFALTVENKFVFCLSIFSYAFVEYRSPEDADYSIRILNSIKIYGKALRVNKVQNLEEKMRHSIAGGQRNDSCARNVC